MIWTDRSPQGCLVIPNVIEIDGGRLHWDIDDDRPIEQPEPGQGMLNEFLTLQDADDEQIGAYARRWGILGVCHHGVPASHAAFANAVERPCRLLREETDLYAWEPLERWRYFSRQAGAILNLAARLHADQPGRPEDWQQVITRKDRPVPWWKPSAVRSERIMLGDVATQWITLGNVRPVLTWRSTNPGPAGGVWLRGIVFFWSSGLPTHVAGHGEPDTWGSSDADPAVGGAGVCRLCHNPKHTATPSTRAMVNMGRPTRTGSNDGEPPREGKAAEAVVAPRASSAHTHDRPLML